MVEDIKNQPSRKPIMIIIFYYCWPIVCVCQQKTKYIFSSLDFSVSLIFFFLSENEGQRGQECPLEALSIGKGFEKLLRTKISILSAGLGGSVTTFSGSYCPKLLNESKCITSMIL